MMQAVVAVLAVGGILFAVAHSLGEPATRASGLAALLCLIGAVAAPLVGAPERGRRLSRRLGRASIACAGLHLLCYVALATRDSDWTLGGDLAKRPFLLLGMTSLVALVGVGVRRRAPTRCPARVRPWSQLGLATALLHVLWAGRAEPVALGVAAVGLLALAVRTPMGGARRAAARAASAVLLLPLACTLETVTPPETPDAFEAVVFPGEAELGGSAGIAISSNYVPQADLWERYDLHPDSDTVEIHLVDELDAEVPATVRGVFNLQPAPTSALAASSPGAFVTVALFDLPDAMDFAYTPSTTFVSDVLVTVRGVRVDDFKGTIRIKGENGSPTSLDAAGFTPPMEPQLAPQTKVIRLRPVRQTPAVPDGFPAGAEIGGLQVDVRYVSFCVTNPRAHATAEASGANVHLEFLPESEPYYDTVRLVMTRFGGFTLGEPLGGDPDLAGEGPFFDLAFDRVTGAGSCGPISSLFVTLANLYVTDAGGATLIDMRNAPDPDSTHLFALYAVDRDD